MRANGWVGQAHMYLYDLPSKKSSLQKIFGFVFLNLTTREACGIAANHWAELRSAREKIGHSDLSSILESILNSARTYYQREC